jgi:hypothetical protein
MSHRAIEEPALYEPAPAPQFGAHAPSLQPASQPPQPSAFRSSILKKPIEAAIGSAPGAPPRFR